MKIIPDDQATEIRSQTCGGRDCVRFALVLACLGLGAGLLLPAAKNPAGKYPPMPKGQLQADARTLVATVHYLFEPESNFANRPAQIQSNSPSFAQLTNNWPLEMSAGISNQPPHLGASSNPPAQT